MASSFASTASSASSSLPTPTKSKPKINHFRFSQSNLSFRLSPKPNLPFLTKGSPPCQIVCPRVKAQLDEPKPRRPTKKRRRDKNEQPTRLKTKMKRRYNPIRCMYCGEIGHNKRSCVKNKVVDAEKHAKQMQL